MTTPHTREKLASDLGHLGVEPGDTLFIHSSFRSLGPVQDGAGAVVGALEDAVGPDGLVLMPSFNLVDWPRRAKTWNIVTSPSTVGWLTEYFRLMPCTHRSDHYSHSVAARGRGAKAFVADHLSREGYRARWDKEPWGRTYGSDSPMYRAYQAGGKLLMLGVDYESSTYVHIVETIHWNMLLDSGSDAEYAFLKRPELGEYWDRLGTLNRGLIGDADCRLFPIRDYVDTLLHEVVDNPDPYWM